MRLGGSSGNGWHPSSIRLVDNRQLCPGTKKLKIDGIIETAQRLIDADLSHRARFVKLPTVIRGGSGR